MTKKASLNQFGTVSEPDLIAVYALIARNVSRFNCPKMAKLVIFKPPYFYEKLSQVSFIPYLSSKQQDLSNIIREIIKKLLI